MSIVGDMDPQTAFLIWLPLFLTGGFVAWWWEWKQRSQWAVRYFMSGFLILRRSVSADYGRSTLPAVEKLDERFAKGLREWTEFRAITPNDIAFRDVESRRFHRSGLILHGRLAFDRANAKIDVIGYANATVLWYFGSMAVFAVVSMNVAVWATLVCSALWVGLQLWSGEARLNEIAEYAAYLLAVSEPVTSERA